MLLFVCLSVWSCHVACGILVPWPWIEPGSLTVKAPSPNHWTTREFPQVLFVSGDTKIQSPTANILGLSSALLRSHIYYLRKKVDLHWDIFILHVTPLCRGPTCVVLGPAERFGSRWPPSSRALSWCLSCQHPLVLPELGSDSISRH